MKSLVDKVVQLSSDQVVDSGRSSTNGKRKRTKASLLIQVRLPLLIFGVANYGWRNGAKFRGLYSFTFNDIIIVHEYIYSH